MFHQIINLVFWASGACVFLFVIWILGQAVIEYAIDTVRNWLETGRS